MAQVVPLSREEKKGADRISFLQNYDPEGLTFAASHISFPYEQLNLMATANPLNVRLAALAHSDNLVNFTRLNDIRYINKFLETVNEKLEPGGTFVGRFESKEQRKQRIFQKFPLPLAWLFYYFIDFSWKRVFPKIPFIQKFYYALTKGHNRVLTVPEVLGRLVSCGFTIKEYKELNNKTYFYVEKTAKPAYDEDPTYGPIITLNRVGHKGEMIQVYKFRTMHPYAEYLQEYISKRNGLQEGGKFHDDIRITNWGRIMRKLWLDELPMLYNWLKGDLKLVGVRPLSRHYFELYPDSFRFRRMQYKPGLIPPFYADLPKNLDEILASERKYLMDYDQQPYLTDIKYFLKAFYNILIKRARSS